MLATAEQIKAALGHLSPDAYIEFRDWYYAFDATHAARRFAANGKTETLNEEGVPYSAFAKQPLIDPSRSYTFSDYYKLNLTPDAIASYFGYQHQRASLQLDQTNLALAHTDELQQRIKQTLLYVDFINETARREFLIAPVLAELLQYVKARIRVEYPLYVSEQLQGSIDYFVEAAHQLLVTEAKNADLARGLNQLTAELIALDKYTESAAADQLYGVISIGDVWQFATLDRANQFIRQDIDLYRVPADVEQLLGILIAILTK